MTAKDIEDSIISYRSDTSFGGSGKNVMQNQAKIISNRRPWRDPCISKRQRRT